MKIIDEGEYRAVEAVNQQLDALRTVSDMPGEITDEEVKLPAVCYHLNGCEREEEPNEEESEEEENLEPAEARKYRGIAARLNYMSPDRVDIQFAVKEAARAMSQPKKTHWNLLTKIGRYLVGRPRLIMKFPWQTKEEYVTTYTDSDWAGCCFDSLMIAVFYDIS